MADHIGTRQRQILELLLENKEGLCIDDFTKIFNISRNAIQQHISVLEVEGYIQSGVISRASGRPVRRYVLTKAGINSFPKQYAWFSKYMLSDLKNEVGSEVFQRYMHKLGDNLSHSFLQRVTGKKPEDRRTEVLKIMDDLGYRTVSSEPDNNATTSIKAFNCIFHDLAQTHSEICQFDIALMTSLLEKEVELTECMAKGHAACCFKFTS